LRDLGEGLLKFVNFEAKHVVARELGCLKHKCRSVFGLSDSDALHLHPRQTHVEVLVQLRKPYDSHICDVEGAKISLLSGKVPHSVVFGEHLLLWKQHQIFLLDNSTPEFEVSVELGRFVRADNGLERSEQARGVLDERSKDEFISTLLEASSQIEREGVALDSRVSFFDLGVEDAVEADGKVYSLVGI